jgi:hypothetical protein
MLAFQGLQTIVIPSEARNLLLQFTRKADSSACGLEMTQSPLPELLF